MGRLLAVRLQPNQSNRIFISIHSLENQTQVPLYYCLEKIKVECPYITW
jgi:hypothetical protein